MNTTKIGTEFENKVFEYFSSLLDYDEVPGASKKHSKIKQHPKYETPHGRIIDCDISIENYNPSCDNRWSSLIIIECKCYKSKVDIADLDEFQRKLQLISESGVKGIMVSTVGFSSNFIKQAQAAHIGLLILLDTEEKWYACRNIAYRLEDQMEMFLGRRKIGAFPIAYDENDFIDVAKLLEKGGAILSDKRIIDVPFLSKEAVEQAANDLYKRHRFASKDIAGEIFVNDFPDFRIRFEDLPEGILGRLSLSEKVIILSNDISNDIRRRNFTLAHEIGHLILHRNLLIGKVDEVKDFTVQRAAQLSNQIIKRMEIQANTFASAILMPKDLLLRKLAPLMIKYGINKGFLYLDHQVCNQKIVSIVLSELSNEFNVSKEAMKIRLKGMNLLRESNYQPQRLSYLL